MSKKGRQNVKTEKLKKPVFVLLRAFRFCGARAHFVRNEDEFKFDWMYKVSTLNVDGIFQAFTEHFNY